MLGRRGVHQLMGDARRDGWAVIGILLTAEMWRQLALEMRQAAPLEGAELIG
jgi:hypothetical protein